MMHDDGCAYDTYDENGYIKTCFLATEQSGQEGNFEFERMEYVMNTALEDGRIVSVPMRTQPITIMNNDIPVRFLLEDERIGSYINDIQPLLVCRSFQNKLVFFPYHGDTLVIIDLTTGETRYQSARINIAQYEKLLASALNRRGEVWHESQIPFEMFLEVVRHVKRGTENKCEQIGTKIYEHLFQNETKGRKR
ncbi:MAG: hypothetical protein NC337_07465 [Roseburia sp.]|nr:hypothetical protein [Roseburia sp.]